MSNFEKWFKYRVATCGFCHKKKYFQCTFNWLEVWNFCHWLSKRLTLFGIIRASPWTPQYHIAVIWRRGLGVLKCVFMMLRDPIFSCSYMAIIVVKIADICCRYWEHFNCSFWRPDRKKTAIRHSAVRETSVSQHHAGTIESSPESPLTITALSYWGFEAWSPIMPRDDSVSVSLVQRTKFFAVCGSII